jgi:hypothetical protein
VSQMRPLVAGGEWRGVIEMLIKNSKGVVDSDVLRTAANSGVNWERNHRSRMGNGEVDGRWSMVGEGEAGRIESISFGSGVDRLEMHEHGS